MKITKIKQIRIETMFMYLIWRFTWLCDGFRNFGMNSIDDILNSIIQDKLDNLKYRKKKIEIEKETVKVS